MKTKEKILWAAVFIVGCFAFGAAKAPIISCDIAVIPYDGTKLQKVNCSCWDLKNPTSFMVCQLSEGNK